MQQKSSLAYIALGANKGDRAKALRKAVYLLHRQAGISVQRASPVYETKAHTLSPDDVHPPFLNAVVEINTALTAHELLGVCQVIEAQVGRLRTRRWEPRVIDLDLIMYGQIHLATDALQVPHPRMAQRRFVLQPLADLAPDSYVPAPFDATVETLLAKTKDDDEPQRTSVRLWKE